MDPLSAIAASGMRTSTESLDMLANNLANVSTAGYKSDREFFDLFSPGGANDPGVTGESSMPNIQKNWIDFSQGTLHQTDSELDFAVSGAGFFTVQGPSKPLYTRNGAFRLNANGEIVTAQGYQVLGTDGNPIRVDSARPIVVTKEGDVSQNGQNIGRLGVVTPAKMDALRKEGAGYFALNDSTVTTAQASGEIEQGKIEDSNVGTAESAVQLVGVMRHFDMLQKALAMNAEMNQKAITEVAKSGS